MIEVTMRICHGSRSSTLQNQDGEGSNGVDQHERILVETVTGSSTLNVLGQPPGINNPTLQTQR